MTTLSERHEALEALDAKRTPGEWKRSASAIIAPAYPEGTHTLARFNWNGDANFAAAAPRMMSLIRDQASLIAQQKEEIEVYRLLFNDARTIARGLAAALTPANSQPDQQEK